MEKRKCFRPNDRDIIYENFGNEVVLINLKTGIYYSLTDTAMMIWEYIEKKNCMDDMILSFVEKDNLDRIGIEKEIKRFIFELEKEILIVPFNKTNDEKNKNAVIKSRDSLENQPFSPPVLKKYTDQQELLLLDPIHDVSDLGWPEKNQDEPDAE